MIRSFEARHSLGGRALPCFGGDSSSATTNETKVYDKRVVGGDGSVNISTDGSTNNIYQTDHGAVSGGLALGTQAVDRIATVAVSTNNTLSNSMNSMFSGLLSSVDKSQQRVSDAYSKAGDAVTSATSQLASAWQQSQQPDSANTKAMMYVVAGVAVVAVVAFAFGGRK